MQARFPHTSYPEGIYYPDTLKTAIAEQLGYAKDSKLFRQMEAGDPTVFELLGFKSEVNPLSIEKWLQQGNLDAVTAYISDRANYKRLYDAMKTALKDQLASTSFMENGTKIFSTKPEYVAKLSSEAGEGMYLEPDARRVSGKHAAAAFRS